MKNKNRLSTLVAIAAASALATVNSFAVGLDVTEATGAITESITKGTVVIAAGFAIGALFLVARVIRRGMSSAK